MQDEFFLIEFDGVARIVAALIADNDVAFAGQKINDLAFAFIAPLGADQNMIHRG